MVEVCVVMAQVVCVWSSCVCLLVMCVVVCVVVCVWV